MRPFTSTISLDEARRRLDAAVRPIERTERVRLEDAVGRVAATEVTSPIDVPPFSRSAMDGYAVVAADVERATPATPVTLRLLDRIYTGQLSSAQVVPGACAEIATGAPLPAGADAVVMVEETTLDADGRVQIRAAVAAGQNVGRRGADIAAGDRVLSAGRRPLAEPLGALAAVGHSTSRSTRSRASRSSRPATKSSSRAVRSRPVRSTTSTVSRSAPSSRSTAASPCGCGRRRTPSTRSSRRSTPAAKPNWSCSLAGARLANAIWSSTRSPPAAR